MSYRYKRLGQIAVAAAANAAVVAFALNASPDCDCTAPTSPPPVTAPVAPPTSSPTLITATNLQLAGSFTVPNSADGTSSLAYSGDGMAFNPANESLFVTGHSHHQRTAEIAVPNALGTGIVAELPRASFVQRPADAVDGQLASIASPATEYGTIGGYLVVDDQLVVSGYHYYDAAGSQTSSHFLTDTGLGATSAPLTLSPTTPARWLGGAMTHIPADWQAAFGGDEFLTGLSGIPIASNSSVGPAAASFSQDVLRKDAEATLVLGYPLSSPLDTPESQSEVWNLTSAVSGVVFPEGSGSVLFFGSHGIGAYCYGTGPQCGDSEQPYQGTHAAPYRYQVWAYAAQDLADVYAGSLAPEELRPYEVWELDLPYDAEVHEITGAAYDAATNRIFIGQGRTDGDRPVIHVFNVQ